MFRAAKQGAISVCGMEYLAGFGLSAKCADDFLTDIIDLNHDTSVQAFREMVLNKKNPPMMNFKFLTF